MKTIEKGDEVTIKFKVDGLSGGCFFTGHSSFFYPHEVTILSVEKPAVDWSKVPNGTMVRSREFGTGLYVGVDPRHEDCAIIRLDSILPIISVKCSDLTLIDEVK
jgi:hypothetical protein